MELEFSKFEFKVNLILPSPGLEVAWCEPSLRGVYAGTAYRAESFRDLTTSYSHNIFRNKRYATLITGLLEKPMRMLPQKNYKIISI